jgi:hypothetical protein
MDLELPFGKIEGINSLIRHFGLRESNILQIGQKAPCLAFLKDSSSISTRDMLKIIPNKHKQLELSVPTKKSTKLPTVKSKLASLAAKKPKAGILSGKSKLKNFIGKKATASELKNSFDWYESAKNRFSVANKREISDHFSAQRFGRVRNL